MGFKEQLAEDIENVFINPEEFGDVVYIDGVETKGFLIERSGEYEESVKVLTVPVSTSVSVNSIIEIMGVSYGAAYEPEPDGFGAVKIILGVRL